MGHSELWPAASLACFYKAWHIELPWLKVAKSVCKFVKCGLCEYLKEQVAFFLNRGFLIRILIVWLKNGSQRV